MELNREVLMNLDPKEAIALLLSGISAAFVDAVDTGDNFPDV